MWLLISTALAGGLATLSAEGECPGEIAFEMDASIGGQYLLLAADERGSFIVSGGRCEGLDTGLAAPVSRFGPFPDLDVDGIRTVTPTVPADACGKSFVLLDLSTCVVSEPVTVGEAIDPVDPGGPAGVYVGSYAANAGPIWSETPPYTCLEACAVVFGGVDVDYQCSTEPDVITNTGWYQGWGTSEHCRPSGAPLAEVIERCPTYPSYESGCFSAYNSDGHCAADSVNYCFTR
jgi:hypothetical protein